MKPITIIKAALLLSACAASSHAAVFAGTVPTQAGFNSDSNLFTIGTPLLSSGTTTIEATVDAGKISFGATALQFDSNTYTGTQTILNPVTQADVPVTYSITTNYAPITIPATNSYDLGFGPGGLTWSGSDSGVSMGNLKLTGSYSLSAGGQTVDGTFSFTGDLLTYYSTGNLTVPSGSAIDVAGTNYFFAVFGSNQPLFNETVGGVSVYLNLMNFGVRNLESQGSPVALNAVPEASTLALGALGLLGCLRRRRMA